MDWWTEGESCHFYLDSGGDGGMSALKWLAFDLVLVALATIAASITRENFEIVDVKLIALLPYLVITLAAACLVLPALGIHRSSWQFTSMRDCLRIVGATVVVVLSAVAIGFLVNRLDNIARALPLIQALLIISFLIGARILKRASRDRRLRSVSTPSGCRETVLLIGLNKLAEFYLQCIAEFHSSHVRVAGVLGEGGRAGHAVHSHPVLGEPEEVVSTLRRLETHGVFIDCILVTVPRDDLSAAVQDALSQIQETTNVRLEYLAERMGLQLPATPAGSAKAAVEESPSSKVATVSQALRLVPYRRAKRAIDVAASALALIVLAPLLLLVGLLVAADVGLPVVFWQQRPGLRGQPFRLYKFRTMGDAHDADGRQKAEEERVSAVGNFLRRTRLDELPQLLNILKGDMSLVGPRPLLPVDQPIDCASRLFVRPGLTGWAQIKGGRQISPSDKAALDEWYVRNMSLALDLEIILGTVPMMIFGERVAEAAGGQTWPDLKITSAPNRIIPQEIDMRTR
jgi:lipopolysaccharide/colanic/teichoic acid biosynthesis glycosyltransferase